MFWFFCFVYCDVEKLSGDSQSSRGPSSEVSMMMSLRSIAIKLVDARTKLKCRLSCECRYRTSLMNSQETGLDDGFGREGISWIKYQRS